MNLMIETLLLRSFVLFLIVGSLAGLVIGAMLVWWPERLHRLSVILNRWVSTRQLDRPLERKVSLDPWFYRHHRLTAALILAASLYIVYFFMAQLDRAGAEAFLAARLAVPASLAQGLLDAVVLGAFAGSTFAAISALFIGLRPSMLREFEHGANRWLSLRKVMKPLEIPRSGVDEYVFQHARQAGMVLVLGSLYVLLILLSWFGR